MAAAKRIWRDNIWLTWFVVQIAVTLLIDAVHFYPESLWKPAGSPLHFLSFIRDPYLAQYNDPILGWTPGSGAAAACMAWVPFFLALEVGFLLPTAVYGAYALSGRRGTTGPQELLFLVWALEMAFTTAVCIHDVFWWDSSVYSDAMKRDFIFKLYGPYLVIPTLMSVDMSSRILGRFRALDGVKKMQ